MTSLQARRIGPRLAARLLAVPAAYLLASVASATDVTLRLIDQHGTPVDGSQFEVVGVGVVPQNGTADLTPGAYTVRVFPGILGFVQGGTLFREDALVVGTVAETVELVWQHADFTATIVDQVGAPIAGSLVDHAFFAGGVVANGATLRLPVTEDAGAPAVQGALADGYVVRSRVGIGGTVPFGGAGLFRQYAPLELGAGGVSVDLPWPTAPLTVHVVDQLLTTIPGSLFEVRAGLAAAPSGATLVLPVTEDPAAPPIQGTLADGYDLRPLPAIAGTPGLLYRDDPGFELLAGGRSVDLAWTLAPLTIDVVDTDGIAVAGSVVDLGVAGSVATGGTVVLPVTEDPSAGPVQGTLAGGYAVRVLPGIQGVSQAGSVLYRDDPAAELLPGGAARVIVWEMARGTLHVVDSAEVEITGASVLFEVYLGEISTGTPVALPVNDDALYPTLGGPFAGAYPFAFRLAAGGPLSGTFDFELLSGRVLSPPFVTVGGSAVGLRFDLQPVVDLDGDGFVEPDDCDDTDPTVYPGAPDLPGDAVDQDCDGVLACDPGATWPNHGRFVSCVAHAATDLLDAGWITADQRDELVSAAARSDVGR